MSASRGASSASPAVDPPGSNGATVMHMEVTGQKNLRRYGTVTRYRTLMSDGTEREVIHGQSLTGRKHNAGPLPLTLVTAPPLSLGPDGMVMHFLLRSMEGGLDGLVFGPERSRSDVDVSAVDRRRIADSLTLPNSAQAAHRLADHLAQHHSVDLRHVVWVGISLGAIKGILFSALAPSFDRTVVYSHFVAPVCPAPMAAPTEAEYRRFLFGELGALFRTSGELIAKDVRDRTIGIHENVMRIARPGLLMRYARSAPRDSAFHMFTTAWREAIVNGDAGRGARSLPLERLTTFELFDRDSGSPVEQWREQLRRQLRSGSCRLVVEHGLHTDAVRLSNQAKRAKAVEDDDG
ncbi:MAG: hypothetical protein AB7V43_17020, partial [Acidimicrobiia bacterium]